MAERGPGETEGRAKEIEYVCVWGGRRVLGCKNAA